MTTTCAVESDTGAQDFIKHLNEAPAPVGSLWMLYQGRWNHMTHDTEAELSWSGLRWILDLCASLAVT